MLWGFAFVAWCLLLTTVALVGGFLAAVIAFFASVAAYVAGVDEGRLGW